MSNAPESPEKIRADCLELVDQLYRHRLNTKLLLMARRALQLYANYKANRLRQSSSPNGGNRIVLQRSSNEIHL